MQVPEILKDVHIVFIDAEFTGEHAATTLVALGLVTLDGRELCITLNDYDRAQVTDWLRDNVLRFIDDASSVASTEASRRIREFLDAYAEGKRLYIVSAGLAQDIVLFLELFKHGMQSGVQFHALHDTPDYLRHFAFIDLNTLFRAAGVAPMSDREAFVAMAGDVRRHDALDDARVVRECFFKLMNTSAGAALAATLERR